MQTWSAIEDTASVAVISYGVFDDPSGMSDVTFTCQSKQNTSLTTICEKFRKYFFQHFLDSGGANKGTMGTLVPEWNAVAPVAFQTKYVQFSSISHSSVSFLDSQSTVSSTCAVQIVIWDHYLNLDN